MNARDFPEIALVPETRIGFWFLGTETWTVRVIRVALNDLARLIPERKSAYPVVLRSEIALVPETRIGFWFLGTETWTVRVIRVALNDLARLIPERKSAYPVVL